MKQFNQCVIQTSLPYPEALSILFGVPPGVYPIAHGHKHDYVIKYKFR